MSAANERELALEDRVGRLEDAIADMLDFTVGWHRPMKDAEKLAAINKIGNEALA